MNDDAEEIFAQVIPIHPIPSPKFRYEVHGTKYGEDESTKLWEGCNDNQGWFIFDAASRGKKYYFLSFRINHEVPVNHASQN